MNKANAMIGYGLGGFLSFTLMIVGGALFLGKGVEPEFLGSITLGAECRSGRSACCSHWSGSSSPSAAPRSTRSSPARSSAQFLGWEWGRYRSNRGAPRFTLTWIVLLVIALGVVMTGVDPVQAHGVRGHLLGGCTAFDLRPDSACGQRPELHARVHERPPLQYARAHLPRRHPDIVVTAVPLLILTNVGQN